MTVPDDYLATVRNIEHCKGVLRHAWYAIPSTADHGPGLYIVNKCDRCDTERQIEVDAYGNALGHWRYTYKDKHVYKSVTGSSLTEYRAKYLAEMNTSRRTSKKEK